MEMGHKMEMRDDDADEGYHTTEADDDDVDEADITLEIDEKMLRNEIRKMQAERVVSERLRERRRNATSAKQTPEDLQEAKLRQAIRNEIKGIFEELSSDNITSSWLYGDDQPQNSKKGYVNTMFPGIGFR